MILKNISLSGVADKYNFGHSVSISKNSGRKYTTVTDAVNNLANIRNTIPASWLQDTFDGISPDIISPIYYYEQGSPSIKGIIYLSHGYKSGGDDHKTVTWDSADIGNELKIDNVSYPTLYLYWGHKIVFVVGDSSLTGKVILFEDANGNSLSSHLNRSGTPGNGITNRWDFNFASIKFKTPYFSN